MSMTCRKNKLLHTVFHLSERAEPSEIRALKHAWIPTDQKRHDASFASNTKKAYQRRWASSWAVCIGFSLTMPRALNAGLMTEGFACSWRMPSSAVLSSAARIFADSVLSLKWAEGLGVYAWKTLHTAATSEANWCAPCSTYNWQSASQSEAPADQRFNSFCKAFSLPVKYLEHAYLFTAVRSSLPSTTDLTIRSGTFILKIEQAALLSLASSLPLQQAHTAQERLCTWGENLLSVMSLL